MRNTRAGDGPYTDDTQPPRGPRRTRGSPGAQAASSSGHDQPDDASGTTGKTPPTPRRRQGARATATTHPPTPLAPPPVTRGRRRTAPIAAPGQPEASQAPEAASTVATIPHEGTQLVAAESAPSPRLPEESGEAEIEPAASVTQSEDSDDADEGASGGASRANRGWRRHKDRAGSPRSNALGVLIELRFADPSSSVRSYSELERHSGISREALSRYVTPRADRRRSPTVDTLAAIADAMRISLEQMCRAAVASAQGITLPSETQQHARDEVIGPLCATLTDEQFSAVVELLRQMQPRARPGS